MSALPPKADIRQRIEHVCFVPKADIGRNRASERSVSAASTDDAPFMRLVKIFLRCGYRLHIRIIAIFALKWNPGFDWRPWIPASTRALKNTASDKEWEACVAEEPCARVPRRFPLALDFIGES